MIEFFITLLSRFGFRHHTRNEKGILLKSGAIPVAVKSPRYHYRDILPKNLPLLHQEREGFSKALSQKTCQAINHIQLSGEEHGMNTFCREFLHFYYFPKAVIPKKLT